MFSRIVGNPRLIVLLIGLLIVAGLSALKTLPRMEDPRLSSRFSMVKTYWPGASAQRVEALITRKIEEVIREQKDVRTINSTSRAGVSIIRVELIDEVENGKESFTEAREKVDNIRSTLPAGASKPEFESISVGADTLIVSLNWTADSEPNVNLLGRYAEELEARLSGVNGTEEVEIYGMPEEEILVEVDVVKSNALGLSVEQVSRIVAMADSKISAGELSNDRFHWQMEVAGGFESLERIKEIPLMATASGESIRLRDIAKVKRTPKLPAAEMVIVDGKQSVVVGARMGVTLRIETWRNNTQKILDQFMADLPAEVELSIRFDQIGYTQTRLAELVGNIGVGFVIILVVLLVTLGWRASVIVAASLPLTICFTLYCLKMYGLQIHQMSVTGLVVSLGIMVDNAIVMTDSIAHYRRHGDSPLVAARKSIAHLKIPLLGSTLTTILAFAPIALMPGAGGEFVGPISWAVMFSLVGSYLISFTIVAAIAGRWLPASDDKTSQHAPWYTYGIDLPEWTEKFTEVLKGVLQKPSKAIAGVCAISFMGYVGASFMTTSFFPPADRDMFQVQLFMSPDTSINTTRSVAEELAIDIKNIDGIESVDWFLGNAAPRFYYNLFTGSEGMAFYGQAMVKAVGFKEADRAIKIVQQELYDKYPEALVMALKLEQGPPVNSPVELRIYGPNIETLGRLSDELRLIATGIDGVLTTRSSLEPARKKLWVNLSEERLSKIGMNLTDAAKQFESSLTGVVAGSVIEGGEDVPVRTRVADEHRGEYSHILSGYLVTENEYGRSTIPLAALGDAEIKPDASSITRRNGRRMAEVYVFPAVGVLPQNILNELLARIDSGEFVVPAGYEVGVGGEADGRSDALGEMLTYLNIIVALLVMVVALSFNSFRLTGVIFSVAMLSVGLGLLSVFLGGYTFGFVVIIALMGLMGLAINAAIVILAELKANEKACTGDHDAIIECVLSCCRHIVSTTLTTVGGLIPLMFSVGLFWPPFAIAIIGGTVLTSMVSLFFVPAIFVVMAKKRPFDPVTEEEQGAVVTA